MDEAKRPFCLQPGGTSLPLSLDYYRKRTVFSIFLLQNTMITLFHSPCHLLCGHQLVVESNVNCHNTEEDLDCRRLQLGNLISPF